MASTLGPGVAMLAATVCRRFYVDGETKSKIADDIGMSRFQVARLLELSVSEGIVRFEISTPGTFDADLSEQVRKALRLRRAIVIEVPEHEQTPATIRQSVGQAAADAISEIVTEEDVLGIGWGRTLSVMAGALRQIARCPVVQMGGMTGSVHQNSAELVRQVSAIGHGRAYPLYVPLILQDENVARNLRSQPGVAAAIRHFDQITVGAVSVGSWEPPDSQLLDGLGEEDRALFAHRGIVGEICSTLYRDDGSVVTDLEPRAMAISTDQLRRIKELILVAGGAQKARAVRAAARAGLGTFLVTDSSLAHSLLAL